MSNLKNAVFLYSLKSKITKVIHTACKSCLFLTAEKSYHFAFDFTIKVLGKWHIAKAMTVWTDPGAEHCSLSCVVRTEFAVIVAPALISFALLVSFRNHNTLYHFHIPFELKLNETIYLLVHNPKPLSVSTAPTARIVTSFKIIFPQVINVQEEKL